MRRALPLLVLAAALWGGCRSSSPAAATAAHRTREMNLRAPLSYGGETATGTLRLAVIAESECLMTDCSVRGLRLSFLNRSTRDVRLRFVPMQITADGATYDVPTPNVPQNQEYMPNGVFFTTLLPREFVSPFAHAQNVTVRFGQAEMTLPHNERAPLRALVARLEAPSGAAPGR